MAVWPKQLLRSAPRDRNMHLSVSDERDAGP